MKSQRRGKSRTPDRPSRSRTPGPACVREARCGFQTNPHLQHPAPRACGKPGGKSAYIYRCTPGPACVREALCFGFWFNPIHIPAPRACGKPAEAQICVSPVTPGPACVRVAHFIAATCQPALRLCRTMPLQWLRNGKGACAASGKPERPKARYRPPLGCFGASPGLSYPA
jgi:hypothetical protein